MKLIGKRLLLEPSVSRFRGVIALPENVSIASNTCKVLNKGSLVNVFVKIGDSVICQKGFADRNSLTIGNTFFCTEDNIIAVMKDRVIYPLGRTVLIRRDIAEEETSGGIVIPENRRMQSLYGTIERLGLSRISFKTVGLEVGLKIRLKEWEAHMVEIQLEDGSYGLIVQEKDLLLKVEN